MPPPDLFSYPGHDTSQYWLEAHRANCTTPSEATTSLVRNDGTELLFLMRSTNLTWENTGQLKTELNSLQPIQRIMAIHRHRTDETYVAVNLVQTQEPNAAKEIAVEEILSVLNNYTAR